VADRFRHAVVPSGQIAFGFRSFFFNLTRMLLLYCLLYVYDYLQSFPDVDSSTVFELRHPGVPTLYFRAENEQSCERSAVYCCLWTTLCIILHIFKTRPIFVATTICRLCMYAGWKQIIGRERWIEQTVMSHDSYWWQSNFSPCNLCTVS